MSWFPSGTSRVLAAIGQLNTQLTATLEKILMSQANLETAVQTLNAVLDKVSQDAATIETGLVAIVAKLNSGQAAQIDLTSVNALVTRAQAIQTAVDQAATDTTTDAAPPAPAAPPTIFEPPAPAGPPTS